MDEFEFSSHAESMLTERNISKSWVFETLGDPEGTEYQDDGTMHYIKAIEEFGDRILRVIVNPTVQPKKVVTQFFDRRLKGQS